MLVELTEQQSTEIALLILEKYKHDTSVKQHIMFDAMNRIIKNLHAKVMEDEACNSSESARRPTGNYYS